MASAASPSSVTAHRLDTKDSVTMRHVEVSAAPSVASSKRLDLETVGLLVSEPKKDFEMTPIILDEIRPDELLVEMMYSGICHTDIVLQQGLLPMVDFPAIFGHEGAGIVRGIGSAVYDKTLKEGDSVLLSFTTCGQCPPCESSHPALCHDHPKVNHGAVRVSDGSTPARLRDGGDPVRSQYFGQSSFSKMSVVNQKCVVKCSSPDNMAVLAPMGCGFQTGAGTVLNVLKPKANDSVVVFGMGSVGLAALMAAAHLQVEQIIAVDIVPGRLELAKSELGATHTVDSSKEPDAAAAIKALTGGKGPNFAIDCTGIPRVIESMIECLGPQGTAALVGVPPPNVRVSINVLQFLLENKTFLGVIEGDSNPPEFIPELVSLFEAGRFPVDKLCKTYPITALKDAIHDMHTGKVVKPVLDWSSVPI